MNLENEIFIKYTPNYKLLKKDNIKFDKNYFYIEKLFMNGDFKATVKISATGTVSGTVFDMENNEEFLPLRVEHSEGSYIGTVREEYIKLLTSIRDKYFCEKYFVSAQGNRIAELINKKYGDKPAFMWEDYPTFGVFKNSETGKWYALIMYINKQKLNENDDSMIEVMNIKLDQNKIPELIKKDGFFPAYHMNKKYWLTLSLDDIINDKDIMKYIDESYQYTIKKKKAK